MQCHRDRPVNVTEIGLYNVTEIGLYNGMCFW